MCCNVYFQDFLLHFLGNVPNFEKKGPNHLKKLYGKLIYTTEKRKINLQTNCDDAFLEKNLTNFLNFFENIAFLHFLFLKPDIGTLSLFNVAR